MSPVDVQLTPEPSRDTKNIWLQSWWMAMRLREQLLAASAGLQETNWSPSEASIRAPDEACSQGPKHFAEWRKCLAVTLNETV